MTGLLKLDHARACMVRGAVTVLDVVGVGHAWCPQIEISSIYTSTADSFTGTPHRRMHNFSSMAMATRDRSRAHSRQNRYHHTKRWCNAVNVNVINVIVISALLGPPGIQHATLISLAEISRQSK